MGTRSTIALEFADGTVGQVYCHWDGYLSYNGKILFEHYSDPFKLRDLIDLGDLSSLRPNIGVKHHFSQFDTDLSSEEYEKQFGDMTTFYGRDRNESGTQAKFFKDFEHYKFTHQYEEYEYILRKDGKWYVCQYANEYVPLSEALETVKEEA